MSYSEKRVGFYLAFVLPTVVFILCIPVLYFGRNRYVRQAPAGSVLANALRLVRFASKGRFSWNPRQWYRNMTAEGFWTDALPSKYSIEERPSWMTWDDAWVMEVRRGFKACKVFLLYPIYWVCYNSINNNLISQAGSMTRNGLPNEVVSNLDPFAILIFIPILDLFVYPALRRFGINFTPLKRICAGFFTASLSMVGAAIIQYYIYKTSPCGYQATNCDDPSPLNIWIQAPVYILIALSEIFASITGLEYAFTKAPKNMKSLVMSVFLFMTAISNAIGEALIALSEDPLLIWNYGVFAVLSFAAGCLFWLWFHKLDAEEDALNNLNESKYEDEKRTEPAPFAGEKAPAA
jgi:proton-dependent oligopeptide transporter, POT family